ncbi:MULTISPECIES: hypothetical protein [Streptomyces]|uniref:CchlP n=1 Tax=Streptomyces sindenensis TaxID=67363 RepID=A0ABW6EQI1_9ACTN|nr:MULTISPECIES: hypothetical protein [Streptomyces]WGP08349.1 hypothetical protein QFA72_01005 [Streptomyces sp. SH5]GGP45047.1 hypothetical protein GCM10010231_15430 [Streptomyces sindenensis]
MEAELTALAASGATTFVGLMATEAWTQARGRLARFLGRGERDDVIDAELEESREALIAAHRDGDEDGARDVAAEWRIRIRRALRDNPEAEQELRAILDDLAPQQAAGPTVAINHNTISGGHYNAPVIMAQWVNDGVSSTPRRGPGTA